jgi:hypothetical protein
MLTECTAGKELRVLLRLLLLLLLEAAVSKPFQLFERGVDNLLELAEHR